MGDLLARRGASCPGGASRPLLRGSTMPIGTLTIEQARRSLRALSKHTLPLESAQALFVGQTPWFTHAIQELTHVAEDEDFSVRFVRAKYGGGKSHFLRCLEMSVRAQNWVTAYVVLKHKHVELDRFASVALAVARNVELPDGSKGLPALLRSAVDRFAADAGFHRTRVAMQTLVISEKMQGTIERLSEQHGLSQHFRLALRLACRARLDRDDLLFGQIAEWFSGGEQRLTVDPPRLQVGSSPKALPVTLKPLTQEAADELLRLLALLVQWSGFKGFLLTLDEVEMIGRLPPKRRDNAMQTLRALVDQTDPRLRPPATCMYLAATPEMFEARDMFPSYKALQDRIAELPMIDGVDVPNYFSPVIN